MREAAGYIVFHGQGAARRYLLLRNARHKSWAFPKGHLEQGESARDGARRELFEETGITRYDEIPGYEERISYDVAPGKRAGSEGGYRKTVHIYLAEVGSQEWTMSPEHDEGAWLDAAAALSRLQHENLRQVFRRAVERLADRDRA